MNSYKAIVFDFGNTLIESASLVAALESVLNDARASKIGEEIERELSALYKPDQQVQPCWKVLWQKCFAKFGVLFSEDVGRSHLSEFCSQNETYPQVKELLADLKKQGLKLGLLSNVTGPSDIFQQDLEDRGLAGYFDVIAWSSAIGYRKPSKAAFDSVLSELDVNPSESLMVGDSEIADIAGARAIGMDAVLVSKQGQSYSQTQANYCVATEELYAGLISFINNCVELKLIGRPKTNE